LSAQSNQTVKSSHDVLGQIIKPTKGWRALDLKELWHSRELLFFLSWRNIKVRYKQSVLGAAWAIIQPLIAMVIFSVVFGRLARIPSDGIPYPIFNYAALVPWIFFANGLLSSTGSLVGSSNLIKKVYFPRLIIPISSIVSKGVDFVLAFFILLGMMWFYGIVPTYNVVWLPLLFLLMFITSLGVGLWMTALNVQFRDVRHVVPFLTQIWLFATPVVYSANLLSEPWRTIYGINPMVGVVNGFRWALLGSKTGPDYTIFVSALVSFLIFVSGVFYFQRMERNFADYL
jgi:lipopolysaccharide transport system permease protein